LKIISWNCNGAFRKKYSLLDSFKADFLIIQECENPIESKDSEYKKWASNFLWIGDSKNKGIGVFAKDQYLLEKLDWTNIYMNHPVKYFLPFTIDKKHTFLGVWTHKNNSPNFGYIGQLWKYLKVNIQNLENSIIIGDLNSNKIWDQWDRWWNHSDVVDLLSSKGIESVYHFKFEEKQGEEKLPTFYLQRNFAKSYHIDYCFASKFYMDKLEDYRIGDFNEWSEHSDHNPIFIEFKD
jgi:exonuclease III